MKERLLSSLQSLLLVVVLKRGPKSGDAPPIKRGGLCPIPQNWVGSWLFQPIRNSTSDAMWLLKPDYKRPHSLCLSILENSLSGHSLLTWFLLKPSHHVMRSPSHMGESHGGTLSLNPSQREGVEKREPSCTVGGNVNCYSHYGKTLWRFL